MNFNEKKYEGVFNESEKDIEPLVFSEKLAKALGMQSIYSPPPYFNKLVELGVPYYFKSISLDIFFMKN